MIPRWMTISRLLRSGGATPAPDLWPRIAAGRTAKKGPTLPWRDPMVPRALPVAAVLVTIAIMALLARLAGIWPSSRRPVTGASVGVAAEEAWTSALLPQAVYAQAGRSSLTPVGELDSSRIHPGRWIYESWDVVDGIKMPANQWDSLTIRQGELGSRPVWILTTAHHRRAGMTSSYVDSLYVERSESRPVRHVLQHAPLAGRQRGGNNVTEVRGDTVHFTRTGTRRDVSLIGVLAGVWALATPEALKALIPLLPVGSGWSGTVNLLVEGHSASGSSLRPVPVDLQVVGRGYLEVPAGRFECWEVRASVPRSADAGAKPHEWGTAWVDVGGRGLVRFDPTSWAGDSFNTATHLVSVVPQ